MKVQPIGHPSLSAQIGALGNLRDGWLEGTGKAVDKNLLAFAGGDLVETFPEDLPIPAVCPTPDGALFLEWAFEEWIVSAEFSPRDCELQAVNMKTAETVDESYPVTGKGCFPKLYEFVRRFA